MESAVVFSRAPWSEAAQAVLIQSAHDRLVGIETLRELVQSGGAELFTGAVSGVEVVAAVVQFRQCQHGRELVVVAAGGRRALGFALTPSLMQLMDSLAIQHQCDRIRINASRRGMARNLAGGGYQQQAVIYTKEVSHVL